MLLLEFKEGESASIIDTDANREAGIVKFIGPRESKRGAIIIGFEFDKSYQILREALLSGKESRNVSDKN